MSNKDNLKNKIKKPNATQAFFNSYDTDDIRNKIENKNTNMNMNYNDDIYIQNLIEGKKTDKKKVKKVFTSFYMDPDLAFEVNKVAARGKRGDKSKLINIAIRRLLEEYGVIEKSRVQ